MKFWIAVIAVVLAVVAAMVVSNNVQKAQAADQRAAFMADLAAGKLSTPEAFEARCGKPQAISAAAGSVDLKYSTTLWTVSEHVVLQGGKTTFQREHTEAHKDGTTATWRTVDDPAMFYADHCQ